MKILKNPWDTIFYELISSANKSIKIAAPYVKEKIVCKMLENKVSNANVSLITSFKLMNYFVGASDLTALTKIINSGGSVKNFQKLHSKLYIFDDSVAVISSANLTYGGLISNYEYGILLEGKNVEVIVNDYATLEADVVTGDITSASIQLAKEVLSKVPQSKRPSIPDFDSTILSQTKDVYTGGVESIASSLSGWKLEVFKILNQIQTVDFTAHDLELFIPYLQQKFPNNNNIDAKIRQQLQLLRDIGLVQFNGNGKYCKLWI